MSTCVIVLEGKQPAEELLSKLKEAETPLANYDLVRPLETKSDSRQSNISSLGNEIINEVNFNSVKLLNPQLARKERQRILATWLIPFGFITGLGFSQMTGLDTFTEMGFPNQFEKLIGGLVGMISGWLGSFFAAGSINQENNDDIRALRKKSEQGFWLIILELPIEMELPWELLKQTNCLEIITIEKE